VVEGHTDSSGTDEHNLKLSQERSLAVVQLTLDILGREEAEDRACFLDFLSANGRGSKEPILDANRNEDKDRSRRVVFKIRVRSVEQREFRTILGM
jgi:outer membrane protein OmpA-like peptidoglycan-associated protein